MMESSSGLPFGTRAPLPVLDDLLSGASDCHVHTAPDPYHRRRMDVLNLALQARAMGMRAIVAKGHHFGTAPLAEVVNQLVPGFTLVGSLVLNSAVGGLNPEVVEVAAKGGARVIWMPTFSSIMDTRIRKEGKLHYPLRPTQHSSQTGISLLDQSGKLLPEMTPILEIIKESNLVLATGHISIPEIYAVTRAARKMDIKVLITHPLCEVAGSALNLAQQQELVNMGAYLEHTLNLCMPLIQGLPPAAIVEHARAVGVEHCILSSDFGQDFCPAPPEGFRMMLGNMMLSGLTVKELETMVKTNPAMLLGLD